MNDAALKTTDASRGDLLFAAFQKLLPTRLLSALMYGIAEIRNKGFKNRLIRTFLRFYAVNLGEAEYTRVEAYTSFNDFFTRALKPGVRSQPGDPKQLSSPVDGTVSQFGTIRAGVLIQAKGHDYSAATLLADHELAAEFRDGEFSTIYLAPHNYHRVHLPYGGTLRCWAYVPGRLFSVNPSTARALPGLFARNERMVAIFDTEFGPLAVVMVGALFVGGIETVWGGRLTPPHSRAKEASHYAPMTPLSFARGDELGRFHMGSTVILLAPRGALDWNAALAPGKAVQLGEALASVRAS
ncbi:MAG: archaetidylserine decarboxylase [Nevskia sp.]